MHKIRLENSGIHLFNRKTGLHILFGWDNAVAESFFGSLKRELEYNVFGSIEEARVILFDHIEVFYNRQRLHSFLNYQIPQEFEDKKAA